jgi:phosphocarrier protein FPr/phosphocarrier protein
MSNLILTAPLRGWSAPLDETPDAVFAQRMLGDGVAIDPTGDVLHAPCDGEIISVAPSKHAITIRAHNGAELLMHIGIDTVALHGEGFHALVEAGAKVRAGDPLLRFDLDFLARRAKSLITPIVITNGDRFAIVQTQCNRSVEVGEALIELQPIAAAGQSTATAGAAESTETLTVLHEHGVHARPAALIANFAKGSAADITIGAHGRTANAKSAVALMSLGVRRGDEITLVASGEHAAKAVRELKALIAGLADSHEPARAPTPAPPPAVRQQGNRLRGVIASRGLAVGRAVTLRAAEIQVTENGRGIAHESAEFDRARAEVRTRLEHLGVGSSQTAREVIAAHLEFLDDWELVAAARRAISLGKSAAFAWRRAVRDSADTLRSLGDQRLAERVDDLLDLESQVLRALSGEAPVVVRDLPERAILIAEDLKPSQFVSLDATRLAGVCLAAGGPTSHVAILAAATGVPALVALGSSVLDVEEGAWLVLDAEHGHVTLSPDQTALAAAEETLALRRQRSQVERAAAHVDCRTADGERIEVFANLGSAAEAHVAVAHGAEGCGLLRTEFLFLERNSPPDEEEQRRQYQSIADALAGRPLIVRTLDIGGDKPIPYLPLPAEDNPALGLRGVRTSLWRPDLLRVQLRAILRVQPAGQCRILLPMITDPTEITAVRRMLEEVRRELSATAPVRIGAMIETPASALIAEKLARDVDFFSIGTNDLTQYTLAMDRGHQELAHRIDGLHPAVLRLIEMAAAAGARHSRLVAVCGGLASDPAAVPVLIGLGVGELSVVASMTPEIKSLIRTLTLDACRSLARRALELDTAEAVRALVNEFSPAETRVAS